MVGRAGRGGRQGWYGTRSRCFGGAGRGPTAGTAS